MSTADPGLLVGSWTIWSVAMVTVVCRLASRRMCLGAFRKYQLDDYLMIVNVVAFTGVVVSSNQVAQNGSNYVPDGTVEQWSPEQVSAAEWGSKMLLALEQFMLATLWLVKACFLLLYARMTSGLKEGLAVKALAVYCAVGYVVIQVLYLGVWCRPIYMYWALPVPPGHEQCKTYHNHMITVTVFNITSDLAMLCIPVPLIARAHLPLKRKIVLCVVFSLGVVVVVVAILNRYYNFTIPNSLVFLSWYNGEAGTAVMIANIPYCWTLLRRIFRLGAWSGNHPSRPAGPPTIGAAPVRRGRRDMHSTIVGIEASESTERIHWKGLGRSSQHELSSLDPVESKSAGEGPVAQHGEGTDYRRASLDKSGDSSNLV